jgi:tetratricopeptide (TPR) repeat protein
MVHLLSRSAWWGALVVASVLAAGCVHAQAVDGVHGEGESPHADAEQERLPAHELTEQIVYEYLLAEIAAQRGSPETGAQLLVDLARSTGDPRIARRALEMSTFARNRELALEATQIWLEADPDSAPALRAATALLVAAQRVGEAEPYIEKMLAAGKAEAANGFMQLARLLANNPDKAASLAVVRRLAAKYPELPEAQFAVSQAAHAAGDEQQALDAVRRAAQMKPDWGLAAIFEAQILQKNSPAKAANRLAEHLERYPNDRDVRLSYARLLVGDKRYAEARAQFEKLLADNPDDTGVIYAVGLLAYQLKDYAVAEANLKRLLDLGYRDPDAVRFTLGQIAEDRNDSARAIQWYQSIGKGERYLQSRLRAAQVLAKEGKLDEARRYLRGVEIGEERQRVQLIVAEAQLLRDANRPREAFVLLDDALKKEPDQPELLYDLALTAERIQRFDVLEQKLRKLIRLQPGHAHAYNALGYSLADRNLRLPEARKLIEKALELAPEDSFIIDSMGWVLYREGDVRGAINMLRRAYGERPDAEIGAHLGEVLWVSGQREEAKRVWGDALKNHPGNEALQETVKRFSP